MTSSSYMLERELLGSAKAIIDAHSNASLTQPTTYTTYRAPLTPLPMPVHVPIPAVLTSFSVASPPTDTPETKKTLADLQEQVRVLKRDLEGKDALVRELTSPRDGGRHIHILPERYDPMMGVDRNALFAAQRELEQRQMKIDTLTHDLRETAIKSAAKDEQVNEMRREVDSIKREQDLVVQMNTQLRLRIRELESSTNSFDLVTNKSSLTIASLQREVQEKREQVQDLELRLRVNTEQRETYERRNDALQRRIHEMFVQMGTTVGADYGVPSPAAFDTVMSKFTETNAENTLLKGKVVTLEQTNKALDADCQATRATIQQMTTQLQSYDQTHVGHRLQLDTIRAERDMALHDKETIKAELDTVKARLESVQKAWQNTLGELDQRQNHFSSNTLQARQLENDLAYSRSCFDAFKQQIGQLLSDGYVKVDPKEEEIKEKVGLLMQSSKDRGIIITNLQTQKEQLAKQLQEQIDLLKESEKKRTHTESHLYDLESRLKALNMNYSSADVYRENHQQDKAKFTHFLERLGAIMKIESAPTELGYELSPEVILQRAEHLVKVEHEAFHDQKASVYPLQRRIKQMKEQMENKDMHLDLLKKKVAALEEGRVAKTDLEKEIDDHVILSRKMKLKVESLTQQVNELRNENTLLKSQGGDVHTLKNRLAERENEIRRLLEDISRLENSRDKQAAKISSLQDKIHTVDDATSRTLVSSDNAVRTLSNELRFLKGTLQQVTDREQQLLDFRALIARMLGLDAKTLAVPDYEITARLERLLTVVQSPMAVPVHHIPASTGKPSLPPSQPSPAHLRRPASQQQHPPPHQHHHHVTHSTQGRRRSPSPVDQRQGPNHRARSLSPLHVGIDPRTY